MKVTLLLCDAAQVADGKLYILGGGWSVTGPDPAPSAIAIKLEVDWHEAVASHHWELFVGDDLNLRVVGYPRASFINGGPAVRVFGQADFTSRVQCGGAPTAAELCRPGEVDVDPVGTLYVTDRKNSRLLLYKAPWTTDPLPDAVVGQPDFTTGSCNTGGIGPSSLCGPRGLAFDEDGNLYVAEQMNHRVLVFLNPLVDDFVADAVVGQPDFTTKAACFVPPSASDLCEPRGITVDHEGTLWVADGFNHRVLAYRDPLGTDGVADLVLGQPDFAQNLCRNGGTTARSLCHPRDIEVTAGGAVYVVDMANSRVLAYFDPFGTDRVADVPFGQPSFGGRSCAAEVTASRLCLPRGIDLDAGGNLYVADAYHHRVLRFDQPLP